MAFPKGLAVFLIAALVSSANAQVYFNNATPPGLSEALATSNEILCTYLNVNCAPGQSGFTTPPAPPPPGSAVSPSAPSPGGPPAPTAPTPQAAVLAQIFGRKMKL